MCAPGYGKHIGKGVDAAVGFGIAGFVVAIAARVAPSDVTRKVVKIKMGWGFIFVTNTRVPIALFFRSRRQHTLLTHAASGAGLAN